MTVPSVSELFVRTVLAIAIMAAAVAAGVALLAPGSTAALVTLALAIGVGLVGWTLTGIHLNRGAEADR